MPRQDRASFAVGREGFSSLTFLTEVAVIVALSVATGVAYHYAYYGDFGLIDNYAAVGLLTALLYTLPFLFRDEYRFQDFLERRRGVRRLMVVWNYAFLCLAMIGFLTKTTADFSRGWLVMFYLAGAVAVIGVDAFVALALRRAIRRGLIAERRIMLVGTQDSISRLIETTVASGSGLRVVAMAHLPASGSRGSEHAAAEWRSTIAAAVATARAEGVDDVVIAWDWSEGEEVSALIEAFAALPLSVHLSVSQIIERYENARVSSIGRSRALALTAPPLGIVSRVMKRSFDFVVALVAILLLSPVLALIALLVRLDSRGPAFFRQRRRGYNQKEFRIWKFRTMTTLEDGDVVRQARLGDERITRIGAILRRYNLDELPQLFNVLSGEMSLVGPRPHAVAHDRHYESRIDTYPRRLNVKPGITGWAQVNGHRGATQDEAAMRSRVEHDLFYIENWSLALDLYIILLTVVSPRAYRNAF